MHHESTACFSTLYTISIFKYKYYACSLKPYRKTARSSIQHKKFNKLLKRYFMKELKTNNKKTGKAEATPGHYSRRKFLMYSGAFAGSALLLDSCKKEDSTPPTMMEDGTVDLGSGDVGILNYAYALEQLEAAFYTQVALTPYANISASELALLSDIRDHEIAHREFFKTALGEGAIPALEVDFSAVDFNDRNSVLTTAKTFEDLGVSAYNGAGNLIQSADYLLLAGKIVSVEARHAGYIRDLLSNGSFADNTAVNPDGLDLTNTPADVLQAADPFIVTKISGANLPTS